MSIQFEDNIAAGLEQLPFGLSGDADTDQFLSIYLQRYNFNQAPLEQVLNWLLIWDLPGSQIPSWILDTVGKLLGCPRPDSLAGNDEGYRRVLLVQRIARKSSGTEPDVRKVVKRLGDFGGGANVRFLIPKTVIVTFANFENLAEQGITLDVVIRLLRATIGDVDRLQIWDAIGSAFTWNVEGLGWNQAVWATPLYDSAEA